RHDVVAAIAVEAGQRDVALHPARRAGHRRGVLDRAESTRSGAPEVRDAGVGNNPSVSGHRADAAEVPVAVDVAHRDVDAAAGRGVAGGRERRRARLVDPAIAVVVVPVADLGGGGAGGGVADEASAGAHLDAGALAGADAAGACVTGAGGVLVDPSVAVVVDAVADLVGGRAGGRIADEPVALGAAHLHAFARARPDSCRARLAQPREVLVDRAVAIVVLPVAALERSDALPIRSALAGLSA